MKSVKIAQEQTNTIIDEDIQNNPNFADGIISLRPITKYALSDGKRLRACIVGSLCNFSNKNFILFIEYVHAASLVVDDLPCMDDDNERRGKASVHCKYGEHMAQMAAYNLMVTAMKHFSDGYFVSKNFYSESEQSWLYRELNTEINSNLGFQGICGGQLLDLALMQRLKDCPPREGRKHLISSIRMKTGCLFSLAFILGWVGKGGSVKAINDIKEAGYAFGICYQIIDDLQDIEQDRAKNGGCNNICKYYTKNEIIDMFSDNMRQVTNVLSKYGCWNSTMRELYQYFMSSFKTSL